MHFETICDCVAENFTLKDLQIFCKELKLHVSGSKAQVITRLIVHLQATNPDCADMNTPFITIIRQINRTIKELRLISQIVHREVQLANDTLQYTSPTTVCEVHALNEKKSAGHNQSHSAHNSR